MIPPARPPIDTSNQPLPVMSQVPFIVLLCFIASELYFALSLTRGMTFGGANPLERFYGITDPTSSEIYATDFHAFATTWLLIPLFFLTMKIRDNPTKTAMLLRYVAMIAMMMNGLLVGMGRISNGGKITDAEFPLCLLNPLIMFIIALVTTSRSVSPPANTSPHRTIITNARVAVATNGVIHVIFFLILQLGDRKAWHQVEGPINDRTSGYAWTSAFVLFPSFISVFVLKHCSDADAKVFAKSSVLVLVLCELFNHTKASKNGPQLGSRSSSSAVHVLQSLILLWGTFSHSHPFKKAGRSLSNGIPASGVGVFLFLLMQWFWALKLMADGGASTSPFPLSGSSVFQGRLQGLSVLWSLIPLTALAATGSKIPILTNIVFPSTVAAMGTLVSIGKVSNGGLVEDTAFGATLVLQLIILALFLFDKTPPNSKVQQSKAQNLPLLLVLASASWYYFQALLTPNLASTTSPIALGALNWLALNNLNVVILVSSVLKFGSEREATVVGKAFVAVIIITQLFNQIVAAPFFPLERRIEFGVVHAVMSTAILYGCRGDAFKANRGDTSKID